MKLMAFDTSYDEQNTPAVTELEDMCLIYASYFDMEGGDRAIRFVYAAHDNTKDVLYFARFFSYTDEDLPFIEGLKRVGLFLDENSNGFNASVIEFFSSVVDEDKGITTPMLLSDYDMSAEKATFEGIIQENKNGHNVIGVYAVSRTIQTGLEIINRCIASKTVSSDTIIEANFWLQNTATDRQCANYYTCQSFDIMDISKAIKQSKNEFTGVVILYMHSLDDTNNHNRLTCSMTYTRDHKLRDRSKTIDIAVMQDKYSDIWNILPFGGYKISSEAEKNAYTFIAYNENNGYVVITVQPDTFTQLQESINNI